MSTGHRSLADQLRSWPDERLSRLLLARPDLASPAPQDSAQLASRAATSPSLTRALDHLDRLELTVLDAVVVLQPVDAAAAVAAVHADAAAAASALERLADRALVWESPDGLRALTGVAAALAGDERAGGSGLRPRSPEPRDAAEIELRVGELSTAARAMLEHVADQGGQATARGVRTTVSVAEAATPVEELVARGLLAPRPDGVLVVPGEVGLTLRGGHTTREPVDAPPAPATSERDGALVDKVAAGAAFEAARRTELLLDSWGTEPPAALRNGGLGVRDLRIAAARLAVDEPTAALLIEIAVAAGLAATGTDADGDAAWLPTDRYDSWAARPAAERWQALAEAWLASPRMPGLVGQRDPAGKTWNALVPELSGVHMAETRRMTLQVLAELPSGEVLATGTGGAGVVARLGWLRPRRPRTRAEQAGWTLSEAATLGVTGLGGLASYARGLVEPGSATGKRSAADLLAPLLPPPVDHVLLQADLTAVAPGPLETELARRLQVTAEVESRGGATVYRFTPASVRSALDAGWTAAEVHAFLAEVSRTPVPQPLTYLVDDTARTHGSVRVGYAEAFLRADDEAALAELLHHPKAASLGLRRIAPTVLISDVPIDVLLPRLRELGLAPVVESADGTVHVARLDARRARTPKERRTSTGAAAREQARDTARVAAVVTAIRAGDQAAATRPASPGRLTPSDALGALREAVETATTVVITYVDNHGTRTDRVVEPIRVEGGQLVARDRRADDTRSYAVHRIFDVRAASER